MDKWGTNNTLDFNLHLKRNFDKKKTIELKTLQMIRILLHNLRKAVNQKRLLVNGQTFYGMLRPEKKISFENYFSMSHNNKKTVSSVHLRKFIFDVKCVLAVNNRLQSTDINCFNSTDVGKHKSLTRHSLLDVLGHSYLIFFPLGSIWWKTFLGKLFVCLQIVLIKWDVLRYCMFSSWSNF